MNKKEIDQFKDEMQYYAWLKYTIELLEREKELIEYEMSGVKGISYGEKVSVSEEAKSERILGLIDKYNDLLDKLNDHQKRLDKLNKVLDQMTYYERNMFLLIYEERLSYQQVANRFYISKAGLFYRMTRVLERVKYEE